MAGRVVTRHRDLIAAALLAAVVLLSARCAAYGLVTAP